MPMFAAAEQQDLAKTIHFAAPTSVYNEAVPEGDRPVLETARPIVELELEPLDKQSPDMLNWHAFSTNTAARAISATPSRRRVTSPPEAVVDLLLKMDPAKINRASVSRRLEQRERLQDRHHVRPLVFRSRRRAQRQSRRLGRRRRGRQVRHEVQPASRSTIPISPRTARSKRIRISPTDGVPNLGPFVDLGAQHRSGLRPLRCRPRHSFPVLRRGQSRARRRRRLVRADRLEHRRFRRSAMGGLDRRASSRRPRCRSPMAGSWHRGSPIAIRSCAPSPRSALPWSFSASWN